MKGAINRNLSSHSSLFCSFVANIIVGHDVRSTEKLCIIEKLFLPNRELLQTEVLRLTTLLSH